MIASKVKVIIKGQNRTRLLNKLKNENIAIYNIVSDSVTAFWVKQQDLKVVKHYAELFSVEVEVVDTNGLDKILKKSYKNISFIIAVVISMAVLFASTQFVYNIKVDCANDVHSNKVTLLLKENNLDKVIPKNKVDLKAVENLIMSNIEEVSFATCYIEGFSLMVKVVTNEKPKQSEQKQNLLSAYDSVVTRVMVRSGTSEVKVGERVRAGDVLIGGYHIADNTPSDGEENGDIIETIADGEVYGRVYTHKRFMLPEKNFTYIKTGKSKVKRQIGFNNWAILKAGKSPYEYYELCKTNLKLFSILPINITTYEYFELERVSIDQNTYIENLKNKFDSEFIASMNMDAKLIAKNYEIKQIDGTKFLDIFYETEQRIDDGGYNY